MVRTLKLTVAYDGTDYAGWQFQPGQRTLQETVEQALAKITGEAIRIRASGRTDAGVHALGQVVSFSTESQLPADVMQRALNAELPRDIVVLAVAEAAAGFHAIRSAKRKRYRYVIHNSPLPDVFHRNYAWHAWRPLDAAAMHRAAQCLRGTHDFRSFQTSGSERTSTVRTVFDVSIRRDDAAPTTIFFEIEADGFLYNMVRTIVGSLILVGEGAKPESWLAEILQAADRRAAGQTAPPQGLFLVSVSY